MTDEQKTGKIYQAIIAIMRDVGAVGKDSINEQQKYKYRGAEAVYNRVQPMLATHGVFSVPRVLEEHRETGTSKAGGTMHWAFLKVEYTFYASDGSNVVVVVSGEGMDSGDKATAKALTVAHRYAICQVFAIPFAVEDPEKHSPEWATRLAGGITLATFNELKRAWLAGEGDVTGKTKSQLAIEFASWASEMTGDLDMRDAGEWKQWKQSDVDLCLKVLNQET